jgi:hypothetical protein
MIQGHALYVFHHCISIFPLHKIDSLFMVLILVPLTNVSCTATSQLHNKLVLFTVFILVPLTNVSCLSVPILIISHCILVISEFMLFTAVATAQFWIAFVDAVFNVESITGLLFKSP